jgi:hypothetical protein
VINQSVVPVEWSLQPKIRMSFRCLLAKFVSSVLLRYVIKHLSFNITLIYSHMCDLTYWTHICRVSGFVLKTGCYNLPHVPTYNGIRR